MEDDDRLISEHVDMDGTTSEILVVDDEVFNLEILTEHLDDAGYRPVTAENGAQAWRLLEAAPERFDAVLLDRMMPEMDGMELLIRMKRCPELELVPVIMQTARASNSDILEGLRAGSYYYLTKPFEKERLLAIMKTVTSDHQRYRLLKQEIQQTTRTLTLLNQGRFTFRTLKEGHDLVALLSSSLPEASRVAMGLSELVINAIEHGNLGISYADKTQLNEQGDWAADVERRLTLPQNTDKRVTLDFARTEDEVTFEIQDQGEGFDWENYLEISPARIFDTHGRGIAMARALSFDRMEFLGNGNRVVAAVGIKAADS